jgi:hypothetical protein
MMILVLAYDAWSEVLFLMVHIDLLPSELNLPMKIIQSISL